MENAMLTITASRRIVKYAEGANPEVDEPIEVIELPPQVFTGKEAQDMLQQLGVKEDIANGSN